MVSGTNVMGWAVMYADITSKITNFKTQWYAMAQKLEKDNCYINIKSEAQCT